MEEFAGVSGVWTAGGCEEESAGAVEVVIFRLEMTFSVFNEGRREGGIGWLGRFCFLFFGEGEKEKRSCGYIPL